jgi:Phosphotransferase enzyme family
MDALSAAAALLPDLCVEPAGTLRRSDRSEVLRVRVSGPGWPGPDTLIVKLFPDAGESWARESAALAAMPAAAPVPRPIAASADPPAIVMTDAGSGPSALTLADACPDNSIRTTRGYLLIDFEEAEWRPVAWDVAYLTVPWPSCWCCFTLPA